MPDDNSLPVDLETCDREPIHLLGAVQPFGFLLAVSLTDWRIVRASRNVADRLGRTVSDLVGRPLDTVLLPEAVHTVRGHLQTAMAGDSNARVFGVRITGDGLRCDLAVHLVDGTVVIECEASQDEPEVNAAAVVKDMIGRMQRAGDLPGFYRTAAREVRSLTGFDRVMIYRFDHDGSGEVIAESAQVGLESYLGLHYPASDIPRQARILYERNWLRIIPDIDAPPSPIEPVDAPALDLSMSTLRSVSEIHLEYLRNMGVVASMSVSILRDGHLWGLIACHHYSPHVVPFGRRTAAELFGQVFSLMLETRERKAETTAETRAQDLHQRLLTAMAREATRFDGIVAHLDEIADLLACDGIGVWTEGRATLAGDTPNATEFRALVAHLDSLDIARVHAQPEIAAEYPPARAFAARAAGMLVVPLSRPARDYIVYFRREATRSVAWAGDPHKIVTVGPLGPRLTPRKSFELWKETVRGQSKPWLPMEQRIAETLRVSLLEVILRLSGITETERRQADERRELLVAELNHRVRNIFGLIRGIITQSRDSTTTIDDFTAAVSGRIQALARAHDQITASSRSPASLRGLIATETEAYSSGMAERVVIAGPDALIAPEAFTTVALVIHEMITNSVKYGALAVALGRIVITTVFTPDGRLMMSWHEHGGPRVAPPTRRGFGSTVIEQSIRYDLGGKAEVIFDPAGLRAIFEIPANSVRIDADAADDPAHGANHVPAARTERRMPKDVLLVEDTMIIALDTEDMMTALGVDTVRLARSPADALAAIEARAPDFVLLDVDLGSETSFGVAERLTAKGIEFAFATGYSETAAFPPAFAEAPKLRKPYTIDTLGALLERIMATPDAAGETITEPCPD
ncbi:Phytochrome, two-component sensor histidine kinase [Rhodovulum sp. PH10]|uniref:HWE histidine kinase domain-containing protein n=1 Tax=Rhodovulum sp. PH10 TaxID=1187851 RepID=UPI00027C22E0|nr:HWE histidine kinase domain-containing protein [Rhodovulum sp. PH10]EJW13328.1 Phytochrome, two-component sensor histidine kinase [Rhodovulum sp. PH10]